MKKQKHTCGDCGKATGENHLINCDIERCPKCKGQLITCGCDWVSETEEKIRDTDGNIYAKFKVLNSIEEDFEAK